uniref:Uncharacterized protein n=1 Tax=Meloidogyne javanica TaxID=6303 RepID=A0A915LUV9_MELJA
MGIGMRNSFYYMLMTFVISNCWCLKRAVLDDNKIKLYPCPPKQSWCQDHKDYTNDYKCHISSIASRFSEVYKLYPICDEDFKPFDKGAVIVCRAAKRCYVHTLDKIYGHGDKIGKELDDSLGVENSGRVPSGKYDMHIDLFV